MTRNDEEAGRKVGDFLGGVLDGLSRHWKNLVLIVAVVTGGYGWMRPTDSAPYWDENGIATIIETSVDKAIEKRLGRFEAGFNAFVQTRGDADRARIFEAMARYEEMAKRKNRESN